MTMLAYRIESFGGPDAIVPRQVPVPNPGPGEILIEVAYCGVCRHDLLTRAGAFPRSKLPVTLGHQVSGWVAEIGEGVADFAVGEAVMNMIFTGCGQCATCAEGNEALCCEMRPEFLGEDRDGGYAQYVVIEARTALHVPSSVSLAEVAVLTCTLGTAYHAAVSRGGVEPDELVVVTGAGGGVGLHAIEILASLGARPVGVVSAENSAETVRAAGAIDVIVSPERTFATELRQRHGRADVVLDVVGAPTLVESCHAVRPGGRVVVVGNVTGEQVSIPPAYLILKEISLLGTKSCSVPEMRSVIGLVAAGTVRPKVDHIVDIADCAKVHQDMEAGGKNLGRVVLEVAGAKR